MTDGANQPRERDVPESRLREERMLGDDPARRKAQVLAETTASQTGTIAEAMVTKDLDLFLLTRPDGTIPLGEDHGLGLYFRDHRYLRGYDLRFAEGGAQALATSTIEGYAATIELTNLRIAAERDVDEIHANELGISLRRTLDGDSGMPCMYERIAVRNYRSSDVTVPIRLSLDAAFEDIFVVRQQVAAPERERLRRGRDGTVLTWALEGSDGYVRVLRVHLPDCVRECSHGSDGPSTCTLLVDIPAESSRELLVTFEVEELSPDELEELGHDGSPAGAVVERSTAEPADRLEDRRTDAERRLYRAAELWHREWVETTCDNPAFDLVFRQALVDLRMLSGRWDGNHFMMAGIPWFATLFGRDSIITALQALPYKASLAADTVRLLARYQGVEHDQWQDEQPGKILHELRRNELTRTGMLPYAPYYGTIDATLLFLMLVGAHADSTGSLDLYREQRESIDAALSWSFAVVDAGPMPGLIAYESEISSEPIQKGWKDSTNGVVTQHGATAEPPMALIEPQAYAWRAWRWMAELAERDGGEGARARAQELRDRADALHARVHEAFRSERYDTFPIALHGNDGTVADVLTSNPGHALWCGFVDDETAARTAELLMGDDMFSGWGVRTLSAKESRYNPVSYHLGSVWPHDNSIIARGLRRYGHDEPAVRICDAMLEAATRFESMRLPELFAGHPRSTFDRPVRYPVACHPQAWASGSVLGFVTTLLGLHVDGYARELTLRRPRLPSFVDELEVRGIEVAGERVDVRLCRTGRNRDASKPADVEVLRADGGVEVKVEES